MVEPTNPSQVAVVTGAASGIGRHLATALYRRGYRVLACDLDNVGLETAFRDLATEQLITRAFDVRNREGWHGLIGEAVERWGRLDYLFNVAGYLQPGYIYDQGIDQIDRHMDINAKGLMYGTRAAALQMIGQGSGHIVNIASLAGLTQSGGLSLYVASKFAVRGFSLSVAQELRPKGVFLTVVCPDAVQTPMLNLQLDRPEAALTFTGFKTLSVEDIEQVIFERVLPRKPFEVIIPASRGWLAKFSSSFPGLAYRLLPLFVRFGLARQRRAREVALR